MKGYACLDCCTAEILDKTVGQLTTLYHVFGYLVYMMTKSCQCFIANSLSWSNRSALTEEFLVEVRFWYLNLDKAMCLCLESTAVDTGKFIVESLILEFKPGRQLMTLGANRDFLTE